MLDEILIRKLITDDFEILAEFLQKNNTQQIKRQFNPFPLTRDTAYQIACENHLDKYYIAIFEEKITGLGMLRGWEENFPIPSLGLLIDKDFQGMGLGKLMLKYMINEVKRLGCSRIRLTVNATNRYAIDLYNSVGFIEVSRTSVCVSEECDEKILMCKELQDSI